MIFQPFPIFVSRWEIPWQRALYRYAASVERREQGNDNSSNVAVAAELTDKPPVRFERSTHTTYNRVSVTHPM